MTAEEKAELIQWLTDTVILMLKKYDELKAKNAIID